MKSFRLSFALSLLFLVGCHAVENKTPKTTAVNVYPVTYRINIAVTKTSPLPKSLRMFIKDHWADLSTNSVELRWNSSRAHLVANKTRHWLMKRGIRANQIQIKKSTKDANVRFGLQVAITAYKTQVDLCSGYRRGYFHEAIGDCFVESNRWSSMVHPENAVMKRK